MFNRGWIVLIVLVIACAAPAPPPPSEGNVTTREPDIRGTVTHVQENQIRVEATPNEFRGPKAVVTLTPGTSARTLAGRTVAANSIREGQVIRVWFTGAVANSYPLQAEAAEIVVE